MPQKEREYLPEDFDAYRYQELYPDLKDMDSFALEEHYLYFGQREGRAYKLELPLDFNAQVYRIKNPDLAELSDKELEIHYSSFGVLENREYSDVFFDELFFREKNKVNSDNAYSAYVRDIRQIKSQEIQRLVDSVTSKKFDIVLVNHNSTINGATHSLYIMANELKKTCRVLILDVRAQSEELYTKYGLEPTDFIYYFGDPTFLYWLCTKITSKKILFNSANFAMSQVVRWLPRNKVVLFSREIKEHYTKTIPYSPDFVITQDIAQTYKNKPKVQTPILPRFIKTSIDLDYARSVDVMNLDLSKITLGMCGSIGARKNTGLFLDVAQSLPEYNFVWIGGHEDLDTNLKNVHHIKEVVYPYKYYKLLDCFVLFSEHEPFGNVVIENLYLNNKVLTFRDNIYYDFKDELTKNNYFEYPGKISTATAIKHILTHAVAKKETTHNYMQSSAHRYVVNNFTEYKEDFLKTLLASK
jgi:hypothetical protein